MPKTHGNTQVTTPTGGDRHPSEGWWDTLGMSTALSIELAETSAKSHAGTLNFSTQQWVNSTFLRRADAEEYGIPGPPNQLRVGTVTGGDEAEVTITGPAPNQTLNLVLPKGDQGDPGPGGAIGLEETEHEGLFTESATLAWRWDTTVGRRLMFLDASDDTEHMVFGDTGDRDIAALLTPGWSGINHLLLRRVGPHVTLTVERLARDDAATGNQVALTVPDGFAPAVPLSGVAWDSGSIFRRWTVATSGNVAITDPGTTTRFFATWTTNQPWPSTLPGGAL